MPSSFPSSSTSGSASPRSESDRGQHARDIDVKHRSSRRDRSRSRSRERHSSSSRRHHSSHRHRHKRGRERSISPKRDRHRSKKRRKERKHKRSSHHRSRYSSASSTTSSSSSSSSRSPSPPSRFPSPSSLSSARSQLSSFLRLDPSAHPALLHLLSQLDAGQVVVISSITDSTARHALQQFFITLQLSKRRGESGEEGWTKGGGWKGEPLLDHFAEVFEHREEKEGESVISGGEEDREEQEDNKDNAVMSGSSRHPVIGPALPPSRPVIGPSLPPPSISSSVPPTAPSPPPVNEDDDEEALGPLPLSSLTSAESAALLDLQRARQKASDTRLAFSALRSKSHSNSSHEEWMTAAPQVMTGQAGLLAAVTGERGMKGRGFASRGVREAGDVGDWTESPEEREWKRMEKEADREAEKALQRAVRVREEAAEAKGARQSATPCPAPSTVEIAEPSLLELHQKSLAESKVEGGGRSRVGPIFWDREKEMGMRRQKNQQQIAAEMKGATALNDRFALSSS